VAERAVPFAVLAPGGQSGNFWVHRRINEHLTALSEVQKSVSCRLGQ